LYPVYLDQRDSIPSKRSVWVASVKMSQKPNKTANWYVATKLFLFCLRFFTWGKIDCNGKNVNIIRIRISYCHWLFFFVFIFLDKNILDEKWKRRFQLSQNHYRKFNQYLLYVQSWLIIRTHTPKCELAPKLSN